MTELQSLDRIHATDINLWAHVGVLEQERLYGQKFLLDFTISLNLDKASSHDDILETVDYGIVIKNVQELSFNISCNTIEHFSELILDKIESLCGRVPMKIYLRKCNAPVPGFSGIVGVEKSRYTFFS